MLKNSKKVIAVILTVISLFAMCSVGFSAVAADDDAEYPLIYLTGYGAQIFSENGNHKSEMLYPTGVDAAAEVKESIAPILMELAMSSATGDYSAYCDAIYDSFAPIYDDLRLNPDGTVKDNSGTWAKSYATMYTDYMYGMVRFSYDWRLSPITLAAELDEFIDGVCDYYKTDKVNLLGRCYGANIISSYLELYGDKAAAKVNKVVLYIPSTMGIGLVGAIFSGDIDINATTIDVYAKEIIKYTNVMDDGLVKDFLLVMLSVLEQAKIMNFGVEQIEDLLENIKDDLIPRLVRASYGSFPSFWSMVPDEYLDKAVDFIYNTDELKAEYEGTIELITEYNELVQDNLLEKMAAYDNVYVVSKYNLPSAPLLGKTNPTSDGVAETYYTSVGATSADYGSRLSAEYIGAMDEADFRFLSPDEKIDASTCALPEKTWFIKNNYHDHFSESVDALINTIFTTEDITVFTDAAYPQFLDYDSEEEALVAVEGTDEDLPVSGSRDDKFAMLFAFIKFAVQLLVKLVEYVRTLA